MGITPGMANKFFSPAKRPDSNWGPPSFLFGGSPRLKWPVRETDYSSLSSTEVKSDWIPVQVFTMYTRTTSLFAGSGTVKCRGAI